MNLNPRLFHLLATMLGALALIFSTADASAQDAPVLGTLKFAPGCTVLVNGKKQVPGCEIHAGDVIKTSATCKAKILLADGGTLAINPSTRVRVYLEGNVVVAAVLVGGVNYFPATKPGDNEVPVIVQNPGSGADPLPFLAAFGFGNFSFPSIGGNGSGSTSTGKIAVKDAKGNVIGYALTNSTGAVVAFTDVNGRILTLASTAPNGTPLSSVFGLGATF